MEKPGVQHVENENGDENLAVKRRDVHDLEAFNASHGKDIEENDSGALTEDHRQYLIQRYGTVELDPIPDMTDADPYNWPTWKVSSPLCQEKFQKLLLTGLRCRKSSI